MSATLSLVSECDFDSSHEFEELLVTELIRRRLSDFHGGGEARLSLCSDLIGKGRESSMQDKIFESFLQRQFQEGMSLADGSDLLELYPVFAEDGSPPQEYLARLRCKGLIKSNGEVFEWDCFEILIYFPSDYLRTANAFQVLSWSYPIQVFHPNISDKSPFICIGRLAPGTSLVDILFQCWEIITYNKVTMREDDALNPQACVWARQHRQEFPVDRRPLKRRVLNLQLEADDSEMIERIG